MAIAKLLYDTSSNWLCNAELVLLSTILSRARCTGYLDWLEGIASHSEPTRLHAKLSITEIDNWSQWLLRGCLFAPSDCRNQGRLQESRSTNVSYVSNVSLYHLVFLCLQMLCPRHTSPRRPVALSLSYLAICHAAINDGFKLSPACNLKIANLDGFWQDIVRVMWTFDQYGNRQETCILHTKTNILS